MSSIYFSQVLALHPAGEAFHVDADSLKTVEKYAARAHSSSVVEFLLNIIPSSLLGAFVSGDLLQVLFVSLLVAVAIAMMNERGEPALHVIEQAGQLLFGEMQIVVKAAPIGAFGAMAYAIGEHGVGILLKLLALMAGFYITAGLFIVVILGLICWWCGFSIFRFRSLSKTNCFWYSAQAHPRLLYQASFSRCNDWVALNPPWDSSFNRYSFNLDGTNIYMAMAAVFLAQATNTPLSLYQQLSLLIIAMITSKGASGITGAGFVTLIATLQVVPGIPVESVGLLVGIDRFMSECRALTNLLVMESQTVAISRWENEVTAEQLRTNLDAKSAEPQNGS